MHIMKQYSCLWHLARCHTVYYYWHSLTVRGWPVARRTVLATISLTPDDAAYARAVAMQHGWSLSAVVREALSKLRADPVVVVRDMSDSDLGEHNEQ